MWGYRLDSAGSKQSLVANKCRQDYNFMPPPTPQNNGKFPDTVVFRQGLYNVCLCKNAHSTYFITKYIAVMYFPNPVNHSG